jgi:hypothetical protein
MTISTVVGIEDLRCELASGVESTSWRLHVAAMEILHAHGKLLDYTADEYCAAVKAAECKTGLGSVHVAMRGSKSESTYA